MEERPDRPAPPLPCSHEGPEGIPMGVVNDYHQDTTPGSGHLLAPPADFLGDGAAYVAIIERRFRNQAGRNRLLRISAQFADPNPRRPAVRIEGPFRSEAEAALLRLSAWTRRPNGGCDGA